MKSKSILMIIVLLFSVIIFSPEATAANTTTYSIKDQNLKKLTFYVTTLKKKKDYESMYYSYQLATKYANKSKKVLSKKVQSQYYINGDTSCAAGSDDRIRVINEKSSPSIIYVEGNYCGPRGIAAVYMIKNGNLQSIKLPKDTYLSVLKYTGKNKLQGWLEYRDGGKEIYNFTYNAKTNSLKLVNSSTK